MEIEPLQLSTMISGNIRLSIKLFKRQNLMIEIRDNKNKIYQKKLTDEDLKNHQNQICFMINIDSLFWYIEEYLEDHRYISVTEDKHLKISYLNDKNNMQSLIIKTKAIPVDKEIYRFGKSKDAYQQVCKITELTRRYSELTKKLQEIIGQNTKKQKVLKEQFVRDEEMQRNIEISNEQILQEKKLIKWQKEQIKMQKEINEEQIEFFEQQKNLTRELFMHLQAKILQIKQQISTHQNIIKQILEQNKISTKNQPADQTLQTFYLSPFSQINMISWTNYNLQKSPQLKLNQTSNIIKRHKLHTNGYPWITLSQSLKQFNQVYLSIKIINLNLLGQGIPFGIICSGAMNKAQVFHEQALLFNPIGRIWNGQQDMATQSVLQSRIVGLLFDRDSRIVSWFNNMRLIESMKIPDYFFQQQIFPIIYLCETYDQIQLL